MQLLGILELKNRLIYSLDSVKKGEHIVVTDTGKPVEIQHCRAELRLGIA